MVRLTIAEWSLRGRAFLTACPAVLAVATMGCLGRWAKPPASTQPASGLDMATGPALVDGQPMIRDSERPSALSPEPDATRIQMQFDVLRVDLPLHAPRSSLEVWKHVDETQNDPRLTELLARNGLRVGVAAPDAWPALRALFESRRSRSLRAAHPLQAGAPLSMRLGDVQPGESVFVHGRDGRLSGATFDGGTKYLHVDYALDPDDPRRTRVRITPEIQNHSEDRSWTRSDQGFSESAAYEGQVFSELSADAVLGPGEFLVIGLSEEADLKLLVGSRFLQREESNATYESVICLTPSPVRLESAGR